MSKTILLIDGENFKGKIKFIFNEHGKEVPMWHRYDFKGLFDKVLSAARIDKKIFYFARIKIYKGTLEKSNQLIEEQRLLKTHLERQGFEVILSGRVRPQEEFVKNSQKKIVVFREKGVDVKIAVDMTVIAYDKSFSEIILASSDSDLQPAIHEVNSRSIICKYLGFKISPNKGLLYTTKKAILIRDSDVIEFEENEY